MKIRLLIIALLLAVQAPVLTGCAALVGGAAGAAVYGAAQEADEDDEE